MAAVTCTFPSRQANETFFPDTACDNEIQQIAVVRLILNEQRAQLPENVISDSPSDILYMSQTFMFYL